jgi:hemerythrin-like domain-containing protein
MKPIGPLMWEHRLIEQMLHSFEHQVYKIRAEQVVNVVFIDMAVDFIRTYADRTHHGKEEDILFRELSKKALTPEHNRIMAELVAEHVYARKTTERLVVAKERFMHGEREALPEIADSLVELAGFYPHHIEKEDKHFFYPCMDYFTNEEQGAMLQEFWDFDRNMIHEKYHKVVETLEALKAG